MSRTKALVAVTALFLIGVLVGVLATHVFYLRAMRRPGAMADFALRFMANDLDRRLHLSNEQRRQLDEELRTTRADIETLRHRMTPEFLAILDRTRQRVEPILTPEQRRAWETFREENRRRIERFANGE